jgi:hypothetical protein
MPSAMRFDSKTKLFGGWEMNSAMKNTLIAMAVTAFGVAAGCSDSESAEATEASTGGETASEASCGAEAPAEGEAAPAEGAEGGAEGGEGSCGEGSCG